MMEKEPEKFEMFVRKFYELLDRLPEKKIQQLLPLLEKVNVLVDQYNAKAIAKNNETLKTSPVNTNIETKIST